MQRRRGGFGAMACGVAIGLTMAGGTMLMAESRRHRIDADEVVVGKVVIVDAEGRTRGVIGMSTDGASGFVFRDEDRRDRAVLEVRPGGPPTLALNAAGGQPGAVLAVDEDDRSFVQATAKDKVSMSATPKDGAGVMILAGKDLRPVAVWAVDGDGELVRERRTAPPAASGSP